MENGEGSHHVVEAYGEVISMVCDIKDGVEADSVAVEDRWEKEKKMETLMRQQGPECCLSIDRRKSTKGVFLDGCRPALLAILLFANFVTT